MKALFRLTVIAACAGAGLALLNHVAAVSLEPPAQATPPAGTYVAGEVLVKFKPASSELQRTAAVAFRGHALLAELNPRGWVQVRIGAGQTMDEALAAYRNNSDVESVQPNYIYRAAAVPNDTQYGQLWAFRNTGQTIATGNYLPTSGAPGADINIESAWDHVTDCGSVVVAVIDTGVNYNQEDLAGNMWDGGPGAPNHGTDFIANDDDPMDLNGHGTHVAGIIAAAGNNATGTTGVCWKASIMAVRVLDAMGSGTTAGVLLGINFAVSRGAKVINLSLSGGSFDLAFSNAISAAQASDVVVVVAAGNDTNNNDAGGTGRYPCNFSHSNLVCVAALDQNYALANFSNWGATSVDVGAPGTNIRSTWPGTSASIPDSLTAGWTFSTTTSGGWAFGTINLGGVITPVLRNPPSYPTGQYMNSTDDRAHKAFNLAGANVAVLQFLAAANVLNGDHLRLGHRSAGGDPFAGGTIVTDFTGVATFPVVFPQIFDISGCISTTCSIGFQLQTDSAQTDRGAVIARFRIDTLTHDTASYNTIDGTSLATPMVAGLAAMLRAYSPQYTYADTVNAIRDGGRPVAALNGITTTGRAIDAMSSLAFINRPAGLTATVD